MSFWFYKNGEQEGRTVPVLGVSTNERGEKCRDKVLESEYGAYIVYTCM
jgi:hypothetical protein